MMSGFGKPAASPSSEKGLNDFKVLTGLKEAHAKECFNKFGAFVPALASFVQSFSQIPAEYFEDKRVAEKNTTAINSLLKVAYEKAREVKKAKQCTDVEAFKVVNVNAASADATPITASTSPAAVAGTGVKKGDEEKKADAPKPAGSVFGVSASSAKTAEESKAFAFGQKSDSSNPFAFGLKSEGSKGSGFGMPAESGFGQKPEGSKGFGFGQKSEDAPKPTGSVFGVNASDAKPFAHPFGGASTADAKPSTAPSSGFNFGFGQGQPSAPAASTSSATVQSTVSFGNGFGKAHVDPVVEAPKEKKPVKYCKPTHFTGPLLEMPNFWDAEVVERCTLLNLNYGFLEEHKDTLRPRMEKWVAKASFYKRPVQYVEIEDNDEEVTRVIIKDAERTFFHSEHRKKFISFLYAMYNELHSYGQAMSYLAGLCLLSLNEEETAAVIRFVSKTYIPNHWAAEAVGFATSAWTVEYYMKTIIPDVAKHLDSLNLWPDTYLQKILTGLCVHVLHFSELFQFLDLFMERGFTFLIQFCLSIVEHFHDDLMHVSSSMEASAVYEIMRLDSHAADRQDVLAILRRAENFDLSAVTMSMESIRTLVYDEKVQPRLARAPKTETFEPCAVCEKKRPIWWNDDLGAVCDDCKKEHPDEEFSKY